MPPHVFSISAMAAEGVNFYGRVGLDVFSHYNKISEKDVDGEATLKSRGKVAPSVALEVTKDLDSNLELGLAYVFTGAKVKISDEGTSESFRANNSAIRLTVGYKFSI